ncbi:hypothetical protein ACROYT_G041154 [Oculina patagonica]
MCGSDLWTDLRFCGQPLIMAEGDNELNDFECYFKDLSMEGGGAFFQCYRAFAVKDEGSGFGKKSAVARNFITHHHHHHLGQSCPSVKGAMKLTLCEAQTRESRPDHNTGNSVPYSMR